jgi:hypothetical protein
MTHYKKLFPATDFLGPQDFPEPKEVTISRVAASDMPERDGKKERRPCLWIMDAKGAEYPRKLKLPKSVLTVFAWMFGPHLEDWVGQKITLKAAWCLSFGEVQECVRPALDDATTGKIKKWLKTQKSSPHAWECRAPDLISAPQNGEQNV